MKSILPLVIVSFLLSTVVVESQPTASCATNGTRCPPPNWSPVWNLSLSTICQPGGGTYFVPPVNEPWGLISLDWSVAKSVWDKNGLHNGTIEATSRTGCAMIKAVSPMTKCFIYHNMELALEAMESQRSAMYPGEANYDPALFLRYVNGTIYNEPGGPGDQYFWDFRNVKAAQYYTNSVMASISYPETDGTFTDDVSGFPAEHGRGPGNLGMNSSTVGEIQYATSVANAELIEAAVGAGKYVWQAFGAQDGVGPGPSLATCATWTRDRCTADYQKIAITQSIDDSNFNASLASFLVTRPPIAFLGYGWESDQRKWRSEFLWAVGEPIGSCVEVSAGVFSREWTYGNATIDCNKWVGYIPVR
jgi:hypothetical protein